MGSPQGAARRGLPGFAIVLSALVTAMVVNAVVVGQQPATVSPTVVSPLPVVLTGVTGTTVTAGAVASTSGVTPPFLGQLSILSMARQAPNDWNVVLAVTAASGITTFALSPENLVIAVGGQSLSLIQSTTYPQVTSAVTLTGSGLTLTFQTASLLGGCHSCSVTAELRITPASGNLPSFVYPWTIVTAA